MLENETKTPSILEDIQDLSLLVISTPKKELKSEFNPKEDSVRVTEWFEGTGTIIGTKRNHIFIITSIHCIPTQSYSYFVKGKSSRQSQVRGTLCMNHFEAENNGLDVAVLSCDISSFDTSIVQKVNSFVWDCPLSTHYRIGEKLWCVHYPNLATSLPPTHRLRNPVFPDVSVGTLHSLDAVSNTFDSTIIASEGSSGGLVIDSNGHILGIHDSQHNDHGDGITYSTHRMLDIIKKKFSEVRQLQGIIQ